MSEAKHTPGPWTIIHHMGWDFQGNEESGNEMHQMGFVGPNGERVCWFGNCEQYYPTEGAEPKEADARLIAAAPCLLDALCHAVDYLNGNGWEGDPRMVPLEAAIAKAKGQALTRAEPRASMAEQFEAEMSSAADRKKAAEAKGQP